VAITGQGMLDGQGPPWWEAYAANRRLRLERRLPREAEEPPEAPLRFPRPRLINLIRCQGSLISGLGFREGPSWNVHLVYCQDATIDGLNMAGLQAQDCCGIIIDSCKQVRIANCSLASGADCIGIKAGYNEDGRRVGLPSEDIVVTNCNLTHSYAAGIAIGSETAGGIKNVAISNCVITNCKNGVNMRSTRGRGGVVERVRVSNVVMDRLDASAFVMVQFFDSIFQGIANPNEPAPSRTAETDSSILAPLGPGTPTFRDIDFSGLTVGQVNDVGRLEGLPERFITGVNIHDVSAPQARGGLTLLRAREVSVSRLRLGQLDRPALVARQVQGLDLDRLACRSTGSAPAVQLENVADAFVHGCNVAGSSSFVDQRGSNRAVVLEGNHLRGGAGPVARKT
jgi:Glycosyl hydrolases family 28